MKQISLRVKSSKRLEVTQKQWNSEGEGDDGPLEIHCNANEVFGLGKERKLVQTDPTKSLRGSQTTTMEWMGEMRKHTCGKYSLNCLKCDIETAAEDVFFHTCQMCLKI